MIELVHPDGTRVPLLGMRSTRTGALRPLTDAELAKLRKQWADHGSPLVRVEGADAEPVALALEVEGAGPDGTLRLIYDRGAP